MRYIVERDCQELYVALSGSSYSLECHLISMGVPARKGSDSTWFALAAWIFLIAILAELDTTDCLEAGRDDIATTIARMTAVPWPTSTQSRLLSTVLLSPTHADLGDTLRQWRTMPWVCETVDMWCTWLDETADGTTHRGVLRQDCRGIRDYADYLVR